MLTSHTNISRKQLPEELEHVRIECVGYDKRTTHLGSAQCAVQH